MNSMVNSIENLTSTKILQAIVKKTSDLIHYDVVICNHEGIIIAATQKNRVGIFNEQVRNMIKKDEEFLIIENIDGNSFRAGINLPIKYEQQTVGSVGITGEPEDVKLYGKLIQAFIEQQILLSKRERDKEDKRHLVNNFIYSWIFKDAFQKDSSFEIRGLSLGIDTNIPYIVCLISSQGKHDTFNMQIQHFIERFIGKDNHQHISTMLGSEIVLLLNTSDSSYALRIMTELKEQLSLQFNTKNAIGIGCVSNNPSEIRLSYDAAKLACSASKNTADKTAIVFSHNMSLLISSANSSLKQAVYNYVFRNYKTEKQIDEAIQIISNYINANRSLKTVARDLFMHENTIQKRLDKVYELTGYNPRNALDLTMLHSVILIHMEGIRKVQ